MNPRVRSNLSCIHGTQCWAGDFLKEQNFSQASITISRWYKKLLVQWFDDYSMIVNTQVPVIIYAHLGCLVQCTNQPHKSGGHLSFGFSYFSFSNTTRPKAALTFPIQICTHLNPRLKHKKSSWSPASKSSGNWGILGNWEKYCSTQPWYTSKMKATSSTPSHSHLTMVKWRIHYYRLWAKPYINLHHCEIQCLSVWSIGIMVG